MSEIISATTSRAFRGARFLSRGDKARMLRAQAQRALDGGNVADALEYGYRCALRCAGAIVAESPVGSRKRLPRGVWAQLELVGPEEAQWAERLKAYSSMRSRVLSGLSPTPERGIIQEFLQHVDDFLEFRAQRGEQFLEAA